MNSLRCPSCGLLQFAKLPACKRCGQSLMAAQPPPGYVHAQSDFTAGYGPPPGYQAGYGPPPGYAPHYSHVHPANLNTSLAMAAMIVGIISIPCLALCGLGILSGLVALVMGIVALRKASQRPTEYGGKGFAVAGIATSALAMLMGIPVIAAIAIPNLIAARRAANEGSTLSALKTIASAEAAYQRANEDGKFGDLRELAAKQLIKSELAGGVKDGYRFQVTIIPAETSLNSPAHFAVTATPLVKEGVGQTGTRAFYVDETQVIRFSRRLNAPATANDPALE